jgi:hypothetical protein
MPCALSSRTGDASLGDAFELALAAKVGLELGEHPEHVEEALAGGRYRYR